MSDKENYRYAYICEGITDEDKLKKIGCFFVIPTGGTFIRKELYDFIIAVSKVRRLILVLDPDGPGNKIEENLKKHIDDYIRINFNKKECIKHNKVGVAQASITTIKEELRPCIEHDIYCDELFSFDEEDYLDFDLVGEGKRVRRNKIIDYFSLPYTSSKKVEECLLMLRIKKEEIERILND